MEQRMDERRMLGLPNNTDGRRQDPTPARTPGDQPRPTTDAVPAYLALLASVSPEVRNTFHLRILGPLIAYDAAHRSKLVLTLEVFLAHSGSWSAAAAELHLHVNTLRYRIRRVEQLTGHDPNRLEHQVDFFLALRAAQLNRRPSR
jgi:DNA-binding PucR family transcriptional regulator